MLHAGKQTAGKCGPTCGPVHADIMHCCLYLSCTCLQLGETVSFLLGRFLLRKWVAELTADWPMWAALNAALREDGWKLVLLLRMSPAIPFSVINYALGSSSLPVRLMG